MSFVQLAKAWIHFQEPALSLTSTFTLIATHGIAAHPICTAIMGKSEKSQHEVCGLCWNLWVGLKQEVEEEVPKKQVLKS